METLYGLGAADGRAMGQALVLKKSTLNVEKRTVLDPDREVGDFYRILESYSREMEKLCKEADESAGEDAGDIFRAYSQILKDEHFFDRPIRRTMEDGINLAYALNEEKKAICSFFESMDDVYMKERAGDIKNVCDELVYRLLNGGEPSRFVKPVSSDFILFSINLSPQDTMSLDKTYLRGLVTEKGGLTSHTVILAKALGIPAVTGAVGIVEKVRQGRMAYINGCNGEIVLEPDKAFSDTFLKNKVQLYEEKQKFRDAESLEAITRDGFHMDICVNLGDKDTLGSFDATACDGVGLFRTEFIYLERNSFPREEEQFEIYKNMAVRAGKQPVIIRTLDIGGDKIPEYMDIEKEDNPFLGYRAIRICLDRPKLFKTQLRAILRASAYGCIKIMFPMIVTLTEFRQAKLLLSEVENELDKEGIPFDKDMETGIMIETPSAVMVSDLLADEADFFSIGTNDLTQYMLAADRMNEKVQYLYDWYDSSVLRAVAKVAENANHKGIPVGICGEAAADPLLIPLWAALGIGELSMVRPMIGRAKYIVRSLDRSKGQDLIPGIMSALDGDMTKERIMALAKAMGK